MKGKNRTVGEEWLEDKGVGLFFKNGERQVYWDNIFEKNQ